MFVTLTNKFMHTAQQLGTGIAKQCEQRRTTQ